MTVSYTSVPTFLCRQGMGQAHFLCLLYDICILEMGVPWQCQLYRYSIVYAYFTGECFSHHCFQVLLQSQFAITLSQGIKVYLRSCGYNAGMFMF